MVSEQVSTVGIQKPFSIPFFVVNKNYEIYVKHQERSTFKCILEKVI